MSNKPTRNRVPPGTPTGGQFATTNHGESDLALNYPDHSLGATVQDALRRAGHDGFAEPDGDDIIVWNETEPDGFVARYRIHLLDHVASVRDEETDAAFETWRFSMAGEQCAFASADAVTVLDQCRTIRHDILASATGLSPFEGGEGSLRHREGTLTFNRAAFGENNEEEVVIGPYRSDDDTWSNDPYLSVRLGGHMYEVLRENGGGLDSGVVVRREGDGTTLPRWEAAGVLDRIDEMTGRTADDGRTTALRMLDRVESARARRYADPTPVEHELDEASGP